MKSTQIANGMAVVLAFACLTGCGSLTPLIQPRVASHPEIYPCRPLPDTQPKTVSANFWKEIRNWQGVPYRRGGISTSGVDCSGLTYRFYDDLYGIQLPRTTEEQIHTGKPVSQKALKPGDLVFFKFRDRTGHVGIYLNERRFIHASGKKRGVTISCLDSPYWKARFRGARRVLESPQKQVARNRPGITLSDRTRY
ncbi:C40 family peptidase [Desulfococcus sp.]|uniref:C40 family peptidase n=1 Tax=Desulfococcus sp. TaxID=2025834 RepID=UPI003593C7EB